jgi:hypothetical protein
MGNVLNQGFQGLQPCLKAGVVESLASGCVAMLRKLLLGSTALAILKDSIGVPCTDVLLWIALIGSSVNRLFLNPTLSFEQSEPCQLLLVLGIVSQMRARLT